MASKSNVKVLDDRPIEGRVFRLVEQDTGGSSVTKKSLCARLSWDSRFDDWTISFYQTIDQAMHDRNALTGIPANFAVMAIEALEMLRNQDMAGVTIANLAITDRD